MKPGGTRFQAFCHILIREESVNHMSHTTNKCLIASFPQNDKGLNRLNQSKPLDGKNTVQPYKLYITEHLLGPTTQLIQKSRQKKIQDPTVEWRYELLKRNSPHPIITDCVLPAANPVGWCF